MVLPLSRPFFSAEAVAEASYSRDAGTTSSEGPGSDTFSSISFLRVFFQDTEQRQRPRHVLEALLSPGLSERGSDFFKVAEFRAS